MIEYAKILAARYVAGELGLASSDVGVNRDACGGRLGLEGPIFRDEPEGGDFDGQLGFAVGDAVGFGRTA